MTSLPENCSPESAAPGAGTPRLPDPSGCDSESIRSTLAGIRVVLVEPSHPGNIGAVARAMKAMGLARLYLVRPQLFPSAEATARAAGADDLLVRAVVCEDLAEALRDCVWAAATSARSRHLPWPGFDPVGCAREALARAPAEVALVFGREATGLSNSEIDLCQATVRIPTDDAFPSLNLGGAVQVLSYEVRRAVLEGGNSASATPPPLHRDLEREPSARVGELDAFFVHLERALVDIGYLDPSAPRLLMRRLRRLFNRTGLLRSELAILRGVLRAAQRSAHLPRR